MEQVHAATVRELINNVGLKDRHAQNLVVNAVYSGDLKQKSEGSPVIVPAASSIEDVFNLFLDKKRINLDDITSEGLSNEASELLVALN